MKLGRSEAEKLKQRTLIVLVGLLFLGLVKQAQALGLTVAPMNNYVRVNGGETLLLPYVLQNGMSEEMSVTLQTQSFAPDENGLPALSTENEFPYLTLVEATISGKVTIPTGEKRTVQVAVATPLGVREKEYPLTLLFNWQGAASPNLTAGSQITTQLGSNLVVLVGESRADQSRISLIEPDFSAYQETWQPQPLVLQARNESAFGTLVSGKVVLTDGQGKVVLEREIYPDLILGGSERRLRLKEVTDGETTLVSEWQWPPPLLGRYTLEIYLGNALRASAATVPVWSATFYALPYSLSALVLSLLVLGILVKVVYNKKKPKDYRKLEEKVALMEQQKEFFADEEKE